MILDKLIFPECWKNFELSVSALILLAIILATNMQYAISKRLRLNNFSALNIVWKWFVLTLKSFKGFELKMKKIINAPSEILAACGGIRGMMTHF
jgi:hypothetical protein